CLSLLSISSPASIFSTESNRFPRLMDSMDNMKLCRRCRCRRPATQNICPCPVIQIVPNKSGSERVRLIEREGSICEMCCDDCAGRIGGLTKPAPFILLYRSRPGYSGEASQTQDWMRDGYTNGLVSYGGNRRIFRSQGDSLRVRESQKGLGGALNSRK